MFFRPDHRNNNFPVVFPDFKSRSQNLLFNIHITLTIPDNSDRHDITEILLNVTLNTINHNSGWFSYP